MANVGTYRVPVWLLVVFGILFSVPLTVHAIHGWAAAELSVSGNRWAGGNDTLMAVTASYIWRFRRRAELLFGVPVGPTGSTDHKGGVFKLTFEAGGKAE